MCLWQGGFLEGGKEMGEKHRDMPKREGPQVEGLPFYQTLS